MVKEVLSCKTFIGFGAYDKTPNQQYLGSACQVRVVGPLRYTREGGRVRSRG